MFSSGFARRSLRAQLVAGSIGLATGAIALGAVDSDDRTRARAVLGQAKGLKYVVEQKAITAGDPTDLAACPGQTAVTGGGALLDTSAPNDGWLTNSTPYPAGDPAQKPDEGWLAEGDPIDAQSMLTYAICSNRPGKLRYASRARFVAATSSDSATARCPRGTALTGGGALTDSDLGAMRLLGSTPSPTVSRPRTWRASAINFDDEQHSLSAYAICSKQEDRYSYKRARVDVPDGGLASAHKVVNCSRRRAVSGGGAELFGMDGTDQGWLITSSPQPAGDPSRLPKRGWIGEAGSIGGGTLEVWAICKK